MALEQELKWGGLTLPKVYIKVHSVFGSKMGWNSVVRIYCDKKSARLNPEVFIKEMNVTALYDPDNLNPFKLIYEAVKLSPEFKEAQLDDEDQEQEDLKTEVTLINKLKVG